jgi:hypothetical protein
MRFVILSGLSAVGLFLASLILLAVGRRIGERRLRLDPDGGSAGHTAVETAVFGLLGLLLAFTFSGATQRFDERRQLIGDEANSITAAYRQADLLLPEPRASLRDTLRRYLEARIAVSRQPRLIAGGQEVLASEPVKRSEALQSELWRIAVDPRHSDRTDGVEQLLLPTLTSLFAIARNRVAVVERHPPEIIFVMLFVLTLVSSLLAGYGMAGGKRPSWLHMVGFALSLAATVFVIFDIEFPRSGLIRIDTYDHVLADALRGLAD